MIQSPPLFELGLDSGGAISAEELAIAAEMPCSDRAADFGFCQDGP